MLQLYSKLKPMTGLRGVVQRYSSVAQLPYDAKVIADKKKFFVTTPIFYVNDKPHLGHVYTAVLADSLARWEKLNGHTIMFSTGTDEHGLKIQQAADKSSLTPYQFCTNISDEFKHVFNGANIRYSDFVRTTEERHRKAVNKFWVTLQENGYIYKGVYESWYSMKDEEFLTDSEIEDIKLPDGAVVKVSKSTKHPVSWIKEENYLFKLSEFRNRLNEWLDKKVITPTNFEPAVRKWVDDLRDISVSRESYRISWGIPVPGDESQTIYVWLDALVNYLTVSGYPDRDFHWPADCHVIGKDILRFHAVYWPAFLMAAGMNPPKRILCHSHWLVDDVKMSKSKGNMVDPELTMQKFSVDGFRYFLLKEGSPNSDSNYTEKKAVECINADLVNTLGNLLSRCTGKTVNPKQEFPPFHKNVFMKEFTESDKLTFVRLEYLAEAVGIHFKNDRVHRAIESILYELYWANGLVEKHRPWELRKNLDKQEHIDTLFNVVMETLRVTSILLQPIIPTLAKEILDRLGIPADKRMVKDTKKEYLKAKGKEPAPLGPSKGPLLLRLK